ncbi:MAG: hypothetical protein ACK520_00935 [Inhella sp.]|jgi:hypothetical protein
MTLRAPSVLTLCVVLALPAAADTLTSSAASLASQSVASLSDSVSGSSQSSSGGEKKVAAGTYRVTEVAQAPQRPGKLQLHLEPAGEGAQPFVLTLDAQLAQREGVARVGALVEAQPRPYGVAFARTEATQPFLLALADAWMSDLDARALR